MKKTATVEKKRNEGNARANETRVARGDAGTRERAHAWRRAIRLEPPRHDDRGEEGTLRQLYSWIQNLENLSGGS